MENLNCCSPNQDNNSNCCPTPPSLEEKQGGFKKRIGMFLMGLALILAISSAFKNANSPDEALGFLLPTIQDFDWLETDKKVAYILLKGAKEAQNVKLTNNVEEVVQELNETDDSAYFTTLAAANEHYENFVEKTGVEKTPTVVVLSRVGNSILLSESASSIKLFRAYVTATTPAASCQPASCKPSKACTPAQKAKCNSKKSN